MQFLCNALFTEKWGERNKRVWCNYSPTICSKNKKVQLKEDFLPRRLSCDVEFEKKTWVECNQDRQRKLLTRQGSLHGSYVCNHFLHALRSMVSGEWNSQSTYILWHLSFTSTEITLLWYHWQYTQLVPTYC